MVSDQILARYVKKYHPDLCREANSRLEPDTIPTTQAIEAIRHRAMLYGKEGNVIFVITFVCIYDNQAILLNKYMSKGIRKLIACELGIIESNVSHVFASAKVRYNNIPRFRAKVDAIVHDFKNMNTPAQKVNE